VCDAGLRKVYPYYFTFTTFTKGRWVGQKILDVFAKEFRAHPVEEYVSAFSCFPCKRFLNPVFFINGLSSYMIRPHYLYSDKPGFPYNLIPVSGSVIGFKEKNMDQV
jgi:hypothetical protein